MSRIASRMVLGLASVGLLALPQSALGDDRSADDILSAIEAIEWPELDPADRENGQAIERFNDARHEVLKTCARLIAELFQVDPDHPKLIHLMPDRWMQLVMTAESWDSLDDLNTELEMFLGDETSPLRPEAAYFKAWSGFLREDWETETSLEAIEDLIAINPADSRAGDLLYAVAVKGRGLTDDRREELKLRVLENFPDSSSAEQFRHLRQQAVDTVGKPFELTFTDEISGRSISVQDDLKGKIVVVDFWATWCGPCIDEMPDMKRLYAEYRDQGVEFIGVSLDAPEDEGGLDALKAYVQENTITWPQYYQGNGWESDFSRSWGIKSIPALFVIDQQGNLHSNQARGLLETMIPELLRKGIERGED